MKKIKWKSREEIELEELEKALEPSQDDIEKAKRELETINLLSDLGVI